MPTSMPTRASASAARVSWIQLVTNPAQESRTRTRRRPSRPCISGQAYERRRHCALFASNLALFISQMPAPAGTLTTYTVLARRRSKNASQDKTDSERSLAARLYFCRIRGHFPTWSRRRKSCVAQRASPSLHFLRTWVFNESCRQSKPKSSIARTLYLDYYFYAWNQPRRM